MALETATYISDLVTTNPTSTDPKSQGDDHLRLIKTTLKNSFAGFPGMVIVTGSEAQGATVNDYTVTISPAPAAYTTPLLVVFKATHANTGAVTVQVNALGTKSLLAVDGTALKTGDIESGGFIAAYYDGTSFYLVSGNDRANRNGETYSGTHNLSAATLIIPTKSQGDNSTNAASTAYVDLSTANEAATRLAADNAEAATRLAADNALQSSKADVASPALTGTPTAPTATPGTNTTQIATTAFVVQQAFSAVLPLQSGNSGKFLTTDGTNASWSLAIPSQTGNSGKYLTTNGTSASWAATSASGSAGQLQINSAGVLGAIASGTSGQILSSQGAGASPIWVSGGMDLISTVTANNSSAVDFTTGFSSTYDVYMIVISKMTVSASANFWAQMYIGGTLQTGAVYSYHYGYMDTAAYVTSGFTTSTGDNRMYIAASTIAGGISAPRTINAVFYIPNPSDTTVYKYIYGTGTAAGAGGGYRSYNFNTTSGYIGTGAMTGISFFMQTGNISTGKFSLYGLKNS